MLSSVASVSTVYLNESVRGIHMSLPLVPLSYLPTHPIPVSFTSTRLNYLLYATASHSLFLLHMIVSK